MSSSAERDLAIDENAPTVSLAPNLCVFPDLTVAVWEGEDSIRDFLYHVFGEGSASIHYILGAEVDDDDGFVDIMSGIIAVGDAESEGWTFADALARANLSVETLAEGVVNTSQLSTC